MQLWGCPCGRAEGRTSLVLPSRAELSLGGGIAADGRAWECLRPWEVLQAVAPVVTFLETEGWAGKSLTEVTGPGPCALNTQHTLSWAPGAWGSLWGLLAGSGDSFMRAVLTQGWIVGVLFSRISP